MTGIVKDLKSVPGQLIQRGKESAEAFPKGQSVALVVKKALRLIGKRPRDYSGHSLRSGLVTAAAIGGADERTIMKHTGHRSVQMVRRYIRDANLFHG